MVFISQWVDIQTSYTIVNIHKYGMIVFKLSNVWYVFIWNFVFTYVFEEGVPNLHSSATVTSSRMHGNVPTEEEHVDSKLLASVYIRNKSPLKTVCNVCFICSARKDSDRMEEGPGLAPEAGVSHANTHTWMHSWRGQSRHLGANNGLILQLTINNHWFR